MNGANTYTPSVKLNTTTTYTMTVRDNQSCTSSDNVVITVLPYCLKVMDAFTPNGDGQNDTWVVTNNGGACTKQVYVTVFNRYGNIVYKDDNYANKWDGRYDGKPVADGTYYYVITYRLINGAAITVKGDVTILR
jgi:gliding motility-associated-like protein